jgi:hypothetical protein
MSNDDDQLFAEFAWQVRGSDGMLWPVGEDPGVQTRAAEVLVRRCGIEHAEALRRLEFQGAATEVRDEIIRLLGDRNGGIWFDRAGRLNIGVVGRRGGIAGPRVARVMSLLTAHGLTDGTNVVAVDYGEQQLRDAHAAIGVELRDLYRSGLISSGLKPSRNAVWIDMATSVTAADRARLVRVAERAPVRVLLRRSHLDTFFAVQERAGRR